jgi:hypothetical protein
LCISIAASSWDGKRARCGTSGVELAEELKPVSEDDDDCEEEFELLLFVDADACECSCPIACDARAAQLSNKHTLTYNFIALPS